MPDGNKQPLAFALLLLAVAAGTSLVYHTVNRNLISLASARRHMGEGRYAEALRLYEKLEEDRFQPEAVYAGLAEGYFAVQQPEQARRALLALAASGGSGDPVVMRKLAASALWMGLFHESAEEYRAALRLAPDDRAARLGLARSLAWSGRFDEAVREYRTLLGDKP